MAQGDDGVFADIDCLERTRPSVRWGPTIRLQAVSEDDSEPLRVPSKDESTWESE